MNPLTGKVKIANYSVRLILILLILVSTVTAVSYVVYQFDISVTVDGTPSVTFWNWNTQVKTNTFTYSVTIFPDIKTIDENMTYGIFCDDSSSHTLYLRIESMGGSTNIAQLKIEVYDESTSVLTKEWTNFSSLPTSWVSLTVSANTKYSIWLEITGSSSAFGSSSIDFDLKIDEP